MPKGRNLILVHASKSRQSCKSAERCSYDVSNGNANVSWPHLFAPPLRPRAVPRSWTINERALQRPTDLGYAAATYKEAMAALQARWSAAHLV